MLRNLCLNLLIKHSNFLGPKFTERVVQQSPPPTPPPEPLLVIHRRDNSNPRNHLTVISVLLFENPAFRCNSGPDDEIMTQINWLDGFHRFTAHQRKYCNPYAGVNPPFHIISTSQFTTVPPFDNSHGLNRERVVSYSSSTRFRSRPGLHTRLDSRVRDFLRLHTNTVAVREPQASVPQPF
jgi:hypothetical protein